MWLRVSRFTDFKVDRHFLEGGLGQSQGLWLRVTCKGREKADCNHSRSIVTRPILIVLKNSLKCARRNRKEKRWSRVAAASCISPLKSNANLSYI
jgi:hypothetical protein